VTTVKWGIIGCGDVCEKKSGPAFYKAADSTLVSVMRRDAAKAADFAKRHGAARSTGDADEIINDPEVNIVYIATPPGSHCDYALRVAEAGKHCYVEKPMARHAAETQKMVDAFAGRDLKLFVGYYRRTLPVFVKAKSLLDSGAIGTLTAISHRHCSPAHRRDSGWRVDVAQSGGGLFMDLASHVFDALEYMTGPFIDVHSHAARISGGAGVEEVIGVTWHNDRHVVGTSLWNFASGQSEDVIELIGTEGKIVWAAFGAGVVKVLRGENVEIFDAPYPLHVHQPLVQTIVDELLERGMCPSTGVTAHRTQVVLDQCLNTYYGGREDAFWLRPQTSNRLAGA
jgi:predicted dehydrogenase